MELNTVYYSVQILYVIVESKLMALRGTLSTIGEIREILLADIVLIVAFSLVRVGGIQAFQANQAMALSTFIYYLPMAAVGVSLSFILHEMMHKFVAQRYGAPAEFRTSLNGLGITLITGAFGFLIGIPGATVIYANNFTERENGLVSLAGPLTNFVVFAVFLGLLLLINPSQSSYLYAVISFTIFISILLAFFNMLPIFPLDGSKVLSWNKPIYVVTIAIIFVLMYLFTGIGLITIVELIALALFFSLFYKVFSRFLF
jgi:Zn-dependent protease